MSIQSEITRIQAAKNTLRAKAVALGVGLTTDNLTQLAAKYDGIEDRGTPNASVKEGESYTILEGYYHGGTVNGVAGGGNYSLQAKNFTPTKTETTVTSDDGYYGLSGVTVAAIPDMYQDVTDVTATAADVLSPAVFVDSSGKVTAGTMPNKGAVNVTLTVDTTSYTVPKGYHSGAGKVKIVTETKSATPTTSDQSIVPTEGKVLSSVSVAAIPANFGDATDKTASAGDILEGKTAIGWNSSDKTAVSITGTMADNGTVTKVLDATTGNQSYTIAAGKHSGIGSVSIVLETKSATPTTSSQSITPTSGKVLSNVTVNAIPSNYGDVSDATGVAADVLTGKIVYGKNADTGAAVKLTGTMANNGAVTPASLSAGGTYTIPAGYHNGSGKVTAKSLASQTGVDSGKTAVAAAQMLIGYQGWVNGTKITGVMANNGAVGGTITGLGSVEGDTSFTIPAGYTSGGTVTITNDIESALAAI